MRFGVALFVCWLLPACGGSQGDTSVLSLTDGNSGQTQSTTRGQEVDILLHTIGPGNYGDPAVSSGSVVFLEMSYPSTQNPGGPTQLYRFQAHELGAASISIPHLVRAGHGSAAPFEVTIDVR